MGICWTNDSAAFDYLNPSKGRFEICRLSLDESIEMQIIREFPKENIFIIARSNDGRTIAVSRRQKQSDAILLTSFE